MGFQRFLTAVRDGKPITVYGDGEQTRDFTFVADIVAANLAAAERGRPGSVYNIGGGSRVTLNHVLELIGRVTGKTVTIQREPDQKGDMRHTYADTSARPPRSRLHSQGQPRKRPRAAVSVAHEMKTSRVTLCALVLLLFVLALVLRRLRVEPARHGGAGRSRSDFCSTAVTRRSRSASGRRARQYFAELLESYPQSPLRAEAKLGVGDSYLGENNSGSYVYAQNEYREFLAFYPTNPRADYAQMQLGMVHFNQMLNPQRDQTETKEAIKEFQTFVDRYPNSKLIAEVRKRLARSQGSAVRLGSRRSATSTSASGTIAGAEPVPRRPRKRPGIHAEETPSTST